jgi:sulfur-oxidizing protein SoxY
VKLEIPRLAENGSVVPVIVSVDSPMTEKEYVRSIHLFAEKNHLPRIVEMHLGPYNGKAVVSSRVRVATSQQLTAVAVLSDGSLWSAVSDIEVVTSECGL